MYHHCFVFVVLSFFVSSCRIASATQSLHQAISAVAVQLNSRPHQFAHQCPSRARATLPQPPTTTQQPSSPTTVHGKKHRHQTRKRANFGLAMFIMIRGVSKLERQPCTQPARSDGIGAHTKYAQHQPRTPQYSASVIQRSSRQRRTQSSHRRSCICNQPGRDLSRFDTQRCICLTQNTKVLKTIT